MNAKMDTASRIEYARLVKAGMQPWKARRFVLGEQKRRQTPKPSNPNRAVWSKATALQAEADARGEYLNRKDALRLARKGNR